MKSHSMIRAWSLVACAWAAALLLAGCAGPAAPMPDVPVAASAEELARGFATVPDSDKPWCYWWWIKGNVDEAHITKDLEAMKARGFGGLLMFDSRGYHESHVVPPPAHCEFMSPRWRELLKHSIKEANRLGLQFSINLASDAGALKGPWPVGAEAPKKLIWTSTALTGPAAVNLQLTNPRIGPKEPPGEPNKPEGRYFHDITVLAVRFEKPATATQPAGVPGDLSSMWKDVQTKPASAPALEVVDLSKHVTAEGKLAWNAPAGYWKILRFAHTTMEGHEYDVDILDPKAVEAHFNRLGKTILQDNAPYVGKTLTHFYSVSWEGAAPTWTPLLETEFKSYRGYEIRHWLPVLAGIPVKDKPTTDRFLRDYYKTLGDLFVNNFYGKLYELCRQNGLRWHSESGGPWTRTIAAFEQADQLAFLAQNDMPQGEFWFAGAKAGRGMNRPAAMAAHIYGKRLAATEAFTHMIQHWSAYPAALKLGADQAFVDGSNQIVWHTFTASPPQFGKPGIEYFAGTHINPNVTWHEQAGPFIDYLGRCQRMLRQGMFVADVACYTGESPYQHWGRGEKWSTKATMTLGKGYTYDLVTSQVLLERMSVKDGKLVLPDGMSYRVLVVDLDEAMASPAVLKKIIELGKAGATIVTGQRKPDRAPGLSDQGNNDAEVRELATKLWPATTSGTGVPPVASKSAVVRTPLGKGAVVTGAANVEEILRAQSISPDFEGPFEYTHRRTDYADIYFVAGKGQGDCTFRMSGKEPEFWDPARGRIVVSTVYRATSDGRTIVPMSLPENGSTFVVFRRAAKAQHVVNIAGPEGGFDRMGAQTTVWRNGEYTIDTANDASRVPAPVQRKIKVADLPAPLPISGPWTIDFEPNRGAPKSATFDKLIPLNEHTDEGIKFFSGRAIYKTTFQATEKQIKGLNRLHLGQVMCIAEVKLNGQPLGIVWTDPWTIELPNLKPGKNELEIAVTNTWVNRLIGDAALPPEKRITKTNVAYEPAERKLKIYQSFSAKDKLMPSGLIGPVRIEFGTTATLPLTPAP